MDMMAGPSVGVGIQSIYIRLSVVNLALSINSDGMFGVLKVVSV